MPGYRIPFSIFVVFHSISLISAFRQQSIGVHGILLCGPDPLSHVTVKLWDKDTGPDPDDLMAMGTTDSLGHFNLSGTETELTNIDPKLKVYHDCNNILPCQRKATFTLPDKYIADGDTSAISDFFDLGVVNLETEFEDDERKCF